jgi:hypothetical protein
MLESGQKDVFAGHWTTADRQVLCLVNTADAEAREVSVALPPGVSGKATDLFPAYTSGLAVRDGKLVGTLAPLAVAVCEVR